MRNAATEARFPFDQRCLALRFDQSSGASQAVIDSCVKHSSAPISCFSFRRCDILQMPQVRRREQIFFTDYLSRELLSWWSDSFRKYDNKLFSMKVTNWTFEFSLNFGEESRSGRRSAEAKGSRAQHVHVYFLLLVQSAVYVGQIYASFTFEREHCWSHSGGVWKGGERRIDVATCALRELQVAVSFPRLQWRDVPHFARQRP